MDSQPTNPQVSESPGGFFYGWWIVIVGVLLMGVVFGTIINLFSLFAAPVAKELGATTGDFSLAYSVITLAALPMSPIIGNLLKRIDARILVSAGLIVAVLANLLLSSAKAMWMVYAAAVLQGVGLIAATTIPISVMITNWFVRHRGLALGLATAGSGLGSLVLVPVITNTIASLGWRSAYLVLAGIQAVLIPIAFLVLRNRPEQRGLTALGAAPATPTGMGEAATANGSRTAPVRAGLTQSQVYKTSTFWLLAAALVFSGISVNGMISVLAPMLTDMGATKDIGVWVLSTLGIFVMIGKFGTGWLFDKAGVGKAIFLVALANAAQFIFMLSPTNLANATLFTALHGFGATMVTVTPAYLAATLFGDRDYAAVYGSVSIFSTLGAVLAAPFGLLFYTGKSGSPTALVWAWLVMALIGWALYLVTVRTRPQWERTGAAETADATAGTVR